MITMMTLAVKLCCENGEVIALAGVNLISLEKERNDP